MTQHPSHNHDTTKTWVIQSLLHEFIKFHIFSFLFIRRICCHTYLQTYGFEINVISKYYSMILQLLLLYIYNETNCNTYIVIFIISVPLFMWFEQVLLYCHLHNTNKSLFTKLFIFDWFEFQLHESKLQVLCFLSLTGVVPNGWPNKQKNKKIKKQYSNKNTCYGFHLCR